MHFRIIMKALGQPTLPINYQYSLGKDGTLELITITQAQRKLISGNDSSDYKDIRGNYLILKYTDLININLSFIQFEETIDENGNITAVTPRLLK